MDQTGITLAAMAPANGEPHSPVQMQKLLFLLDREAGELVEGPHFDFKPYNYGPFDKTVYRILERLDQKGLVTVRSEGWRRTYALTPKGQEQGRKLLDAMDEQARQYIERASAFVLKLSFIELVSAIYKAYPDMRENSVIHPA